MIVFWLIYLLLCNYRIAFIASLIFTVHPVQTETVNWISAQSDLLSSFFGVLTLICFVKGINNRLFYLSSIILFVPALLSKEVSVIIPAVMLMVSFFFMKSKPFKTTLIMVIPHIILASAYFVIRNKIIGQIAQTNYWGGAIYTNFAAMVKVYVRYIFNTFLPVNLSVEYDIAVPNSMFNSKTLVSIVILMIFIRLIFAFRNRKEIILGLIFFLLYLLPVSNIFPITALMADRFMYNSMIGAAIAAGFVLNTLSKQYLKITLVSVICIVVSFVSLSIARNTVWKNDTVLWSYTSKNMRVNSKTIGNLAKSYAVKEDYHKAKQLYQKILSEFPNEVGALNGLGFCYYKLNDRKNAENTFLYSLKLNKDNPFTLYNLAVIYLDREDFHTAKEFLEKSVQNFPDYAQAYSALGIAYAGCSMPDKAEVSFIKAIEIQPLRKEFYLNLKNFYQNSGLPDDKLEKYIDKFKKISPDLEIILK